MAAAILALLAAGAAFAGTHRLAGPDWSAHLAPDSRTLRFGSTEIRMELAQANAAPSLSELPGRLRYWEIYAGIHLDFYRAAGELEYDFVLAPGADPARIGMKFPGAAAMVIDPRGDLVLTTAAGQIRHRAPISYQIVDGGLRRVPSRFVLHGDRAGFELGLYDRALPLVIDPVITQRVLAGSNFEKALSVARDSAGNSYFGTWSLPNNASLLRKLSPTGTLLSTTVLPIDNGVNTPTPTFLADFHLAVDAAQNVFIAGQSKSCPANTTRFIGSVANPGIFLLIMKVLPDAATFSYVTCVRLDGNNGVNAITLDTAGNAYIAGFTEATAYPATSALGPIIPGTRHGFLTKVDATGQSFNFSVLFGSGTEATSVARAADGTLFTAGVTGPDLQTIAAFQPVYGGGASDGFLMKVRFDGIQVLSSTFLGGGGADAVRDMRLQSNGQLTLGGETSSSNFPLAGSDSAACSGADGFVTRMASTLASLAYSTCLPGLEQSKVTRINVLTNGQTLAAGQLHGGNTLLVSRLENGGRVLYNMAGVNYVPAAIFPANSGFTVGGTEAFLMITPSLQTFEERADLALTLNGGSAFVQNIGPDHATGVLVSLTAPVGGTVQTADARCSVSGRQAFCKMGTIRANELITPINFNAPSGTRGEVSSTTGDPNLANNRN